MTYIYIYIHTHVIFIGNGHWAHGHPSLRWCTTHLCKLPAADGSRWPMTSHGRSKGGSRKEPSWYILVWWTVYRVHLDWIYDSCHVCFIIFLRISLAFFDVLTCFHNFSHVLRLPKPILSMALGGDGDERLSRAKRGISARGVSVRCVTGKIGPTLNTLQEYQVISIIYLGIYRIIYYIYIYSN